MSVFCSLSVVASSNIVNICVCIFIYGQYGGWKILNLLLSDNVNLYLYHIFTLVLVFLTFYGITFDFFFLVFLSSRFSFYVTG